MIARRADQSHNRAVGGGAALVVFFACCAPLAVAADADDLPTVKYERTEHGQPVLNPEYGEIPMHDNEVFYVFDAERLEWSFGDGGDALVWDVEAWVGDDTHKLYFESEGEHEAGGEDEASFELLYARSVHKFWDVRAGLRYDAVDEADNRYFAALGVQGLAPQWFEVEAALYLSEDGDLSAGFEAEHELQLSQRVFLQSRLEAEFALQDVREHDTGAGLNAVELGTRLHYAFSPKFAPYIGVEWERAVGETKNRMRDAGEDTEEVAVVVGVKFWF